MLKNENKDSTHQVTQEYAEIDIKIWVWKVWVALTLKKYKWNFICWIIEFNLFEQEKFFIILVYKKNVQLWGNT